MGHGPISQCLSEGQAVNLVTYVFLYKKFSRYYQHRLLDVK
jgi:hypothetical protein